MDDLDKSILRILSSDAQTNFKTIAERCRTTVGTVHNRIKRLKEDGVIRRMIPDLDAKKLGYGVTALIQFQIQGAHLQEVEQDLGRDPHERRLRAPLPSLDSTIVSSLPGIPL